MPLDVCILLLKSTDFLSKYRYLRAKYCYLHPSKTTKERLPSPVAICPHYSAEKKRQKCPDTTQNNAAIKYKNSHKEICVDFIGINRRFRIKMMISSASLFYSISSKIPINPIALYESKTSSPYSKISSTPQGVHSLATRSLPPATRIL